MSEQKTSKVQKNSRKKRRGGKFRCTSKGNQYWNFENAKRAAGGRVLIGTKKEMERAEIGGKTETITEKQGEMMPGGRPG